MKKEDPASPHGIEFEDHTASGLVLAKRRVAEGAPAAIGGCEIGGCCRRPFGLRRPTARHSLLDREGKSADGAR